MPTAPAAIRVQADLYRRAQLGRVGGVLDAAFDAPILYEAWRRVSAAAGAGTPGPDGRSARDLGRGRQGDGLPTRWLADLARRVRDGTFVPAAPRLVAVPKADGGCREIGVLNVEDRVVHGALKLALEPVFEHRFADTSHGFRPGRGQATALAAAVALLNRPGRRERRVVVHLDVRDCFGTVPHRRLLARLRRQVDDRRALALVRRLARAGGRRAGWLWPRWRGLVQGGALSPLLCNVHLDAVDRVAGRGCAVLRYADDCLLIAESPGHARRGRRALSRQVRRGGQRLREKGATLAAGAAAASAGWLGVRLGRDARGAWHYAIGAEKRRQLVERVESIATGGGRRDASLVEAVGGCLGYRGAIDADELFAELRRALRRHGVGGRALGLTFARAALASRPAVARRPDWEVA